MARLVKSVVEMEGRISERWALVEDDEAAEPWPDPLDGDFAAVGRPAPRLDGAKRVTGQARYTVDIQLPGMLHVEVLRSPFAHARVKSLDVEQAKTVPGVRAVLTPDSPAGAEGGSCAGLLFAEPDYAGCPIAAVAADTPEAARAGVIALSADIEQLPHILDYEEALSRELFEMDPRETLRGDFESAYAAADARVELTFETPTEIHSALEPHSCVARWDGDELTVWASTKAMFGTRAGLARAFGMPQDQVRVLVEFVGGSFGAKAAAGKEALFAAELARQTGRPVRVANDRHAELNDTGNRPPTRQTMRLAGNKDGKLVAVEAESLIGRGSPGFGASPAFVLYRVENVYGLDASLKLNVRPANAFRAPGTMERITVLEQAIDDLALELGFDPLEFRRRNHVDFDQASGEPYSSKALLDCYERVAELAGWAERDRLLRPHPDGLLRGMGCATQIWGGGGGPPSHATIRLGGDGIATVVTGIQDVGTGTLTAAQVVAAEELGLPVAQVRVTGGDTQPNIYAPLAAGSMTVPSVMPAVRSAAAVVRRKLLQLAGDVFEVSPDDLSIREGQIRSKDRSLDRPYSEVTEKLGNATIDGSGSRGPNPTGKRVNTFGCQIAQVAIDTAVGEVRVEHVWAVHDVGRVVNPLGASSQVEGGIIQAIGFALSEDRVFDPTTGAPTNAWLDDYKVPTIADTPEITVDFAHKPDYELSNVGSKGLGEPPIIPTAAAIVNAFRHATGRRVTGMPMTRKRVLEALA
jgi:xanthine dehydrogenase YagR molybdenum-binding subunit